MGLRLAGALALRGIGAGDVVAVPVAELGRGGSQPLRPAPAGRGAGSDRAHLRVPGGRPHPAAEPGPGAGHHRPLRTPGLRGESGGCLPGLPDLELVVIVAVRGHPGPDARTRGSFLDGGPRPRRSARPAGPGRPRQSRGDRLHVGYHRGAQRGHPHPPNVLGRHAHVGCFLAPRTPHRNPRSCRPAA